MLYKYGIFLFLNVVALNSWAWNIGSKEKISSSAIHATYFMTPNNALVKVKAKAYAGQMQNGQCNANLLYDLGVEEIQTGDYVGIDPFALRSLIGSYYTCMTIFYYGSQQAKETFQLVFDGLNYITSFPANAQVTIF